MKTGEVTIKDIAKALELSPSTVSRALKDHPNISLKTRKKVKDLAARLNYQPNIIAKSLRSSTTNNIGVIIPELVHFFFASVISGIEKVAREQGYHVMICQSNDDYERESTSAQALFLSRVDGLLVSLAKDTERFQHFQPFLNRRIPIVFFDRAPNLDNCHAVTIDDYSSARNAVLHLVEQGCTKIAFFGGDDLLEISKNRLNGYKAALEVSGLPFEHKLVKVACQRNEGISAVEELLSDGISFDGIFTINDHTAIGAMRSLKDHDIKVPEEVAVVGFSDWEMASFVTPTLTSVKQPGFDMGVSAAELLIENIRSKKDVPFTKTILPTELKVRESSQRK